MNILCNLQSNSGCQQFSEEQDTCPTQYMCGSSQRLLEANHPIIGMFCAFGFGDNSIMVIACVCNYSSHVSIKSPFSFSSIHPQAILLAIYRTEDA